MFQFQWIILNVHYPDSRCLRQQADSKPAFAQDAIQVPRERVTADRESTFCWLGIQ